MLAPACGEGKSEEAPHVPETSAADAAAKTTAKASDEDPALEAKGLPEVQQPSAAEMAKHSLTHLPYRRWCKWCVAAKMLNTPHLSRPQVSRSKPLLVFDYGFLKHAEQERYLTVLVGRLYPSRNLCAVPCYQTGANDCVVRRLAAPLRASGVNNFSYMSDQEGALRTMIDAAVALTQGGVTGLVPFPKPPPLVSPSRTDERSAPCRDWRTMSELFSESLKSVLGIN